MKFNAGRAQVTVNTPDRAGLWHEIEARFSARRGFALATLNLDHLVKLRSSPEFAAAYAAQDIVVADGNPIVWLSRLAGQPVELMPGSELVIPLARKAAEAGIGVALLGSTQSALEAAAEHLQDQIEGLEITGKISPPFGFDPEGDDAATLLAQVQTSGAGLCFLALGAPKQEILAARGRDIAPNVGFASIGAGLDFLAGTQKRAPAWARRFALEWAWRLLSNPRRLFMRYLHCVLILPGHTLRALGQRLRGRT